MTTGDKAATNQAEAGNNQGQYFYFVDGEKFDSESEFTTGAIIKSRLPEAKRNYALYLEGHANEPDTLIGDDTSIDLAKEKGPKRFYTVPPASFGSP